MIRSAANRRLKGLRQLTGGKGRDQAWRKAAALLGVDVHWSPEAAHETGALILLEGPHLVEAGLQRSLELVETFATQAFLESSHPTLDRLPCPPTVVESTLLKLMADADSPRGLVAVAKAPAPTNPATLADTWKSILFLDRLKDPGNVGAILRVAEATYVDLVVFSPEAVSWRHPRALRASAGSALRVPIVEGYSPKQLDLELNRTSQGGGHAWYGFSADGADLFSQEITTPRVLAMGSESAGLSAEVYEHCSERLSLPMAGELESLNVATAAAVALFELNRRLTIEA